ncbi:hypothetical protein JP0092_14770 [Helicobacter pylori]|nr:hypothetical protein JP0092_14770 [Helicobacter pylori]
MDEIKTLLVDFFPQAKHFGIILIKAVVVFCISYLVDSSDFVI